jgi:hypothetical protein
MGTTTSKQIPNEIKKNLPLQGEEDTSPSTFPDSSTDLHNAVIDHEILLSSGHFSDPVEQAIAESENSQAAFALLPDINQTVDEIMDA